MLAVPCNVAPRLTTGVFLPLRLVCWIETVDCPRRSQDDESFGFGRDPGNLS